MKREWEIVAGRREDYAQVAGGHYCKVMPVGITQVWCARGEQGLAGVLVVARPALSCHWRNEMTGGQYELGDRRLAGALVNRDFRTIARVVVVPEYQGRGVGTELVRRAIMAAETRFTETLAWRARENPFFEKAGMQRWEGGWEPACIRMMAALAFAGLGPGDIERDEVWDNLSNAERDFLLVEMRELAGPKRSRLVREAGDEWRGLVGYVRKRLCRRPAYLWWEKPEGN